MLLSKLLQDIKVLNSYEDREITDVTDKSGNVKEGCAFVCVTGARFDGHSVAEDVLKRLKVRDYFAEIFTCAEVGCNKEAPEIYRQALKYLGTPKAETVVFEDVLHAIKSRKKE